MKTSLLLLLLLLATPSTTLHAQPIIEPITQNPDAVLLKRIWTVTGSDGDYVGDGCGSVGDINGDSITDFAVHFGRAAEWRVYLGATLSPSTQPIWVYKAGSAITSPIVADVYGDGRNLVGVGTFIQINNGASRSTQLRLFESTGTTLADTPIAIIDPYSRSQSIIFNPSVVAAGNFDGQVGDEVMVAGAYYRRNGKADRTPEVWFYQGGKGFQADTPTKILRDVEPTVSEQPYTAQVVDLDGDQRLDMVTIGQYADGYKLKMWFGTETSPWTWTTPDREITLTTDIGINFRPSIMDFDGDQIPDIAGTSGIQSSRGAYVYLSRSGKSARDRSFRLEDADRVFPNQEYYTVKTTGYFNDSLRHVAMLRLQSSESKNTLMTLLSGSQIGPNGAYDAFYASSLDGLSGGSVEGVTGILDCNGDGWEDMVSSAFDWPGNNSGIAVILAGGPYIPLDQPTVGVRTEPMADHQRGLYLWPNPATTELNIAWRGNLSAMPARLAIHDMAGKLITETELRPELGSARWPTLGVASGTYLLTAYDRSGKVIASTQILVQH
ncbi:MAG: T9SS type A sorting domain-containing protein [Armatimonadetes bacterium]|nr:T9SS type A sorting domain-containing protein [Armatimonadota bacterium]